MIQARTWRVVTAAYAACIFVVSVVPISPKLVPGQLDKVVHLCEYLLLAWMLAQLFRLQRHPRALWAAWWWATGYGALIEGVQIFLPWRSGDIMDALENALGAALGVIVVRRIRV